MKSDLYRAFTLLVGILLMGNASAAIIQPTNVSLYAHSSDFSATGSTTTTTTATGIERYGAFSVTATTPVFGTTGSASTSISANLGPNDLTVLGQVSTFNAPYLNAGGNGNGNIEFWLSDPYLPPGPGLVQTIITYSGNSFSNSIPVTLFDSAGVAVFTCNLFSCGEGPVSEELFLTQGFYNLEFEVASVRGAGFEFPANFSFSMTVVPIPGAVWLFGSGLIGLIGIARRKKS